MSDRSPLNRQLRRIGRETRLAATAYARSLTLRPGSLPTFLIIGAQRGGTTSLYRYLADHPAIRPPVGKELQFFSLHLNRGTRWYRGHFPKLQPGEHTFEASPLYLYHPDVPARVAHVMPDVKLIALLRDPVTRAYSHYLHNREHGTEPLSFAEALQAEERRLAPAAELGFDHPEAGAAARRFSYQARGRYAEQLHRWYAHFQRGQLLVLKSDDLYTRPAETYRQIEQFIGLPAYDHPSFQRHNHWSDLAVSELTPELEAELRQSFAPHNRELADLLGWPGLPWPASVDRPVAP